MLSLSTLLGPIAPYRYDDEGEPAYTSPERVLRVLRRFDWATFEEIQIALESMTARDLSTALSRLVKQGKVQRRRLARCTNLFRLDPTAFAPRRAPRVADLKRCGRTRCPRMAVDGRSSCQHHLDTSRELSARTRDRKRAA